MQNTAPEFVSAAGVARAGGPVVVRGRDLHHECLDFSFVEYLLFAVTGRELDPTQIRILERLWISTAYPDARIWCNRVAGILGSARVDPGLALTAALAACNGRIYGLGSLRYAYQLLAEIPEDREARENWWEQEVKKDRIFAGYGRPETRSDERIPVGLKVLVDAGMQAGPALCRAFWMEQKLHQAKGISMNFAAFLAAVSMDFGLTEREFQQVTLILLTPGYMAVYADQRDRAPLSFLAGFVTAR